MSKRVGANVVIVIMLFLGLISCESARFVPPTATSEPSPLTNPGEPLLHIARLLHGHSVVLKAGETKSLDVILETRKDGPGRVTFIIYRVTGEYSEERLPLPSGLELSVSPNGFMAEPNNTYSAQLLLKTGPELASGTYFLLLECEFENVFRSKGWIEVVVSDS